MKAVSTRNSWQNIIWTNLNHTWVSHNPHAHSINALGEQPSNTTMAGQATSFIFFILNLFLFTYLDVSGLSDSTRDLWSPLRHVGVFNCGMWDLVPWPGMQPGSPALEAWSLSHWTTREVPGSCHLDAQVLCLNQILTPMVQIFKANVQHWQQSERILNKSVLLRLRRICFLTR